MEEGAIMGDYTKVIVNCSIKRLNNEEQAKFREEFDEIMGLLTSAYHCGGELFQLYNPRYDDSITEVVIITQDKYSRNLNKFIAWLKPKVIQGMGQGECFAMAFTEYCNKPKCYYMEDEVIE